MYLNGPAEPVAVKTKSAKINLDVPPVFVNEVVVILKAPAPPKLVLAITDVRSESCPFVATTAVLVSATFNWSEARS